MPCSANPPKARIPCWSSSTPTSNKENPLTLASHLRTCESGLSNSNCSASRCRKSPWRRRRNHLHPRAGRVSLPRADRKPAGLSGDDYRRARAQAAWAIEALSQIVPVGNHRRTSTGAGWPEQVERSPTNFSPPPAEFAARRRENSAFAGIAAERRRAKRYFPASSIWTLLDRRRDHPRAARPLAVD